MLRVIKELPSSTSKVATDQAKEPAVVEGILGRYPGRIQSQGLQDRSQGGGPAHTDR